MSLNTPLKNARGLGSAKDGTGHWSMQRLTAVALIPLSLWIAFTVAHMAGQDYEAVLAYFRAPFHISMFVLFVFAAFYHGALGLQVVIEDYVHNEGVKIGVMIVMKLGMALLGTISVVSILRAAFGS
ncbi:succinate dehydrogenase, hydrophobic membrane anchor protein [Thiolinea disciformis]|uniref:succinate dehydrogenase, hydrophobic membrane anchor protein n=1 Tax=Thiolinea disciformis TaxID=125614 RepID=UPI00036A16BB|nr:succinate dehydrogenase, hydrophobic membrane anchor protein [Thiolinea disciformis]